MQQSHKQVLQLGNHMRNLVGQPNYNRKPSNKKILEQIIDGMSRFNGTAWAPVSADGGYSLMLRQCPGRCGYVWELNIKDEETVNWLVNEINQRRNHES